MPAVITEPTRLKTISSTSSDMSSVDFSAREDSAELSAIRVSGELYSILHKRNYSNRQRKQKIMPLLENQTAFERELTFGFFKEHYGEDLFKEAEKHLRWRSEKSVLEALKTPPRTDHSEAARNTVSLPHREEILAGLAMPKNRGDFLQGLEALGNLPSASARAVRDDFELLTAERLAGRISKNLTGRDEFTARMAKKGQPETTSGLILSARRKAWFERDGISGFLAWHFSSAARRLRRNLKAATQEERDVTDIRNIRRHARYASQDAESFISSKDRLSGILSSVCSGAATTTAMALTATGPLWVCIATSLAAGMGVYIAAQKLGAGRAYQNNDLKKHLVFGSIETLFTLTLALPTAIVGAVSGNAARTGLEQGFKKIASATVQNLSSGVARKTGIFSAVGSTLGNIVVTSLKKETWRAGVMFGFRQIGENTIKSGVNTLTGAAAKKAVTNLVSKKLQ